MRKILLDYNEYRRLCDVEKRYEEMLKNRQSGSGESDNITVASDVHKTEEENKLKSPTLKSLPSITLPASAVVNPKGGKEIVGKSVPKKEKKIPWYFLGIPK